MLDNMELQYKDMLDYLYNQYKETNAPAVIKLYTTVSNSYCKLKNELITSKELHKLADKISQLEKEGIL